MALKIRLRAHKYPTEAKVLCVKKIPLRLTCPHCGEPNRQKTTYVPYYLYDLVGGQVRNLRYPRETRKCRSCRKTYGTYLSRKDWPDWPYSPAVVQAVKLLIREHAVSLEFLRQIVHFRLCLDIPAHRLSTWKKELVW